jgi:hypothetical protein
MKKQNKNSEQGFLLRAFFTMWHGVRDRDMRCGAWPVPPPARALANPVIRPVSPLRACALGGQVAK